VKLTKRLKAKWVKALRSGDYEQGHGCLRDSAGGYCCLGVLAEVAGERSVSSGGALRESQGYYGDESSHKVALPAGIPERLANLNDGYYNHAGKKRKPKSFAWLASYIERYL
jgi:hypothetical protein